MRQMLFALLLSGSFLLAQNSPMSQDTSRDSEGPVTVQGCVTRSNGDYILVKVDPAVSYELQAAKKIKLNKFLGQQVEVTGKESPSLSTSSVTSIKTLDKECPAR
jgi:hypothetical protein